MVLKQRANSVLSETSHLQHLISVFTGMVNLILVLLILNQNLLLRK